MAESYKPTAAMVAAAKRFLKLRETYKRGSLSTQEAGKQGIGSGIARARDIAAGKNMSLATVKRMHAFFSRHEKNYRPDKKEPDGGPTAGTLAWLAWGGSSGKAWAKRIVEQQDMKKSVEVLDDFEEDALSQVANAIEDYANTNIPESEDAFGKFMYFAELLRNDHADVVAEDLELLDTEYKSKLLEIITGFSKSDITKAVDTENHYVTFVCMIPDEVDAHGDITDAEEIRKACINFNKSKTKSANLFHMFKTDSFDIVESYTLPTSLQMEDANGDVRYLPKGTWLTTLEVSDPAVWQKVLNREFNGVSIGARGAIEKLGED